MKNKTIGLVGKSDKGPINTPLIFKFIEEGMKYFEQFNNKKEEMIEIGNGHLINKADYENAIREYYKSHEGAAPLTYEGKVIGRVYMPNNDSTEMKMEITTEEGKKIIEGILSQPIGLSCRKTGSILNDGTVDDSNPPTEFSIMKNLLPSDVMSSEEKLMALLEETFYNGWLESSEEFSNEIRGYYQPEQCKEELKEKFKIWINNKFHCSNDAPKKIPESNLNFVPPRESADSICIFCKKEIKEMSWVFMEEYGGKAHIGCMMDNLSEQQK
jgi:hypothetical protein